MDLQYLIYSQQKFSLAQVLWKIHRKYGTSMEMIKHIISEFPSKLFCRKFYHMMQSPSLQVNTPFHSYMYMTIDLAPQRMKELGFLKDSAKVGTYFLIPLSKYNIGEGEEKGVSIWLTDFKSQFQRQSENCHCSSK